MNWNKRFHLYSSRIMVIKIYSGEIWSATISILLRCLTCTRVTALDSTVHTHYKMNYFESLFFWQMRTCNDTSFPTINIHFHWCSIIHAEWLSYPAFGLTHFQTTVYKPNRILWARDSRLYHVVFQSTLQQCILYNVNYGLGGDYKCILWN